MIKGTALQPGEGKKACEKPGRVLTCSRAAEPGVPLGALSSQPLTSTLCQSYSLRHHSRAIGRRLSILITTRGGSLCLCCVSPAPPQGFKAVVPSVSTSNDLWPFNSFAAVEGCAWIHLAEVQSFKSLLPLVRSTPLTSRDSLCVFIFMKVNLQVMPRFWSSEHPQSTAAHAGCALQQIIQEPPS